MEIFWTEFGSNDAGCSVSHSKKVKKNFQYLIPPFLCCLFQQVINHNQVADVGAYLYECPLLKLVIIPFLELVNNPFLKVDGAEVLISLCLTVAMLDIQDVIVFVPALPYRPGNRAYNTL